MLVLTLCRAVRSHTNTHTHTHTLSLSLSLSDPLSLLFVNFYSCLGRYGLGLIHYRQEKHAIAEGHFRHAVSINPCSPVLLCYQGMVQHAQKKSVAALEMLNRVSLDLVIFLQL